MKKTHSSAHSTAKSSRLSGLLTYLIKEAPPTHTFSGIGEASKASDTYVGVLRVEHLQLFHLYECALLQHHTLKKKLEKSAGTKVKTADSAKIQKRFEAQMKQLAELELQADTWREIFGGSVRVFFHLYDPEHVFAIRQGGKVVIIKKEPSDMSDMMTVPGIVLFGLSGLV